MSPGAQPRHTDNAMLPRQITHQNIFRVLIAGFSLVILLLVGAAMVGVRNVQAIQQNVASIRREQAVTNRLLNELYTQQTNLSEVFSVLARDPQIILALPPDQNSGRDWVAAWRAFPSMRAVRLGRVVSWTDQRLSRLGPSIVDAAEDLCRALREPQSRSD